MSAVPTDIQRNCCPADQLVQGKSAIVVDLDAEPRDIERLNAMGLRVGATFRVQAAAPLFRIQLGGATLALGPEWTRALRVVELSG